jgi:hypothetical protein
MNLYEDPDAEQLGRDECLRLLGSVPIGRVAFTVDALPSVQPVTFVLHVSRWCSRPVRAACWTLRSPCHRGVRGR